MKKLFSNIKNHLKIGKMSLNLKEFTTRMIKIKAK
jgi:hypothetical protein